MLQNPCKYEAGTHPPLPWGGPYHWGGGVIDSSGLCDLNLVKTTWTKWKSHGRSKKSKNDTNKNWTRQDKKQELRNDRNMREDLDAIQSSLNILPTRMPDFGCRHDANKQLFWVLQSEIFVHWTAFKNLGCSMTAEVAQQKPTTRSCIGMQP